jgi:hypothetical protein
LKYGEKNLKTWKMRKTNFRNGNMGRNSEKGGK